MVGPLSEFAVMVLSHSLLLLTLLADVFYAPLDIKQAIEDRLHKGPRIAAAGHYLSITGGGGDINQISAEHCCHSGISSSASLSIF